MCIKMVIALVGIHFEEAENKEKLKIANTFPVIRNGSERNKQSSRCKNYAFYTLYIQK